MKTRAAIAYEIRSPLIIEEVDLEGPTAGEVLVEIKASGICHTDELGRTDVPKIVDWYMDKKIDIDSLVTHVMPIDRINEGFELMRKGESIRGVVTF